MSDCIFCKIAAGEIPSKKAYEDERVFAFYDLEPQAPVHVLIIPKEHIASVAEITEENSSIAAHIFEVAARLAKELGLEGGFRLVANTGADGGQTVQHLHVHLLGGRSMKWPPGCEMPSFILQEKRSLYERYGSKVLSYGNCRVQPGASDLPHQRYHGYRGLCDAG